MRFKSLAVGLVAVAAVSPLSAQTTWQMIGVPNNTNTGAYWNNASDDNVGAAVCNAGAILTNTPVLTAASCVNQGPMFLPVIPAPVMTSNVFLGGTAGSPVGTLAGHGNFAFRFNAGTYTFGLIGRVAGNLGTSWGIITDAGTVINAATLVVGQQTISGPFAVWITQALPASGIGTVYSSALTTGVGAIAGRATTTNQQFSVFTNSTGVGSAKLSVDAFGSLITATGGDAFYVGMEDNVNGGRGFGAGVGGTNISDRDYNDILISIRAVPEPATVGLMGFGLLALAGVAKRRKA